MTDIGSVTGDDVHVAAGAAFPVAVAATLDNGPVEVGLAEVVSDADVDGAGTGWEALGSVVTLPDDVEPSIVVALMVLAVAWLGLAALVVGVAGAEVDWTVGGWF